MAKKKEIVLEKGGFVTTWRISECRGGVDVDVHDSEGNLIMEWFYPNMPGHRGLLANAHVWLDQAIIEARHQMEKGTTAKSIAESILKESYPAGGES